MAKYEFKVGDRVQFKEWDEMEKEFGLNFWGAIRCHGCFNSDMRHLCGTYATIKKICRDGTVDLSEFSTKGDRYWLYHVDMLKPASTKKRIVDEPKKTKPAITYPTITAHLIEGNKTTVMLSDGRIGEVTCYYKDTFDPAVGVAEAYKKALGATKKEDKPVIPHPKFEVGKKYVAGISSCESNKGDIITIVRIKWIFTYYHPKGGYYECKANNGHVFAVNSVFADNLAPYTEPEVKEVKREAKVGEWVKVIRSGEIKQIERECPYEFSGCMVTTDGEHLVTSERYVVLEGYKPEMSINLSF